MTEDGPGPTAEALFRTVWNELVSLLGTTATATLVRRGVRRATPRIPQLTELRVEERGLEFAYTVPASWRDPGDAAGLVALRRLYAEELDPLLAELTGAVIRRRLARIPGLDAPGAAPEEERDER